MLQYSSTRYCFTVVLCYTDPAQPPGSGLSDLDHDSDDLDHDLFNM